MNLKKNRKKNMQFFNFEACTHNLRPVANCINTALLRQSFFSFFFFKWWLACKTGLSSLCNQTVSHRRHKLLNTLCGFLILQNRTWYSMATNLNSSVSEVLEHPFSQCQSVTKICRAQNHFKLDLICRFILTPLLRCYLSIKKMTRLLLKIHISDIYFL